LAEGGTHGGRLYWRNVNVFTSGNKVISELQRSCHYFLSNPCIMKAAGGIWKQYLLVIPKQGIS